MIPGRLSSYISFPFRTEVITFHKYEEIPRLSLLTQALTASFSFSYPVFSNQAFWGSLKVQWLVAHSFESKVAVVAHSFESKEAVVAHSFKSKVAMALDHLKVIGKGVNCQQFASDWCPFAALSIL